MSDVKKKTVLEPENCAAGKYARFELLIGVSEKVAVFWDVPREVQLR
jgi:hypothetical protein